MDLFYHIFVKNSTSCLIIGLYQCYDKRSFLFSTFCILHQLPRVAGGVPDISNQIAQVLDVSPHALSVPDIDSYIGLMHTLFTLEDNYGLKITEQDGELSLQVDLRKNKDAARLHEMLWAWREQAAKLEAGEISQEDYDRWRYHYPEYDSSQIHAKVPPEGLI